jgi:hypothetical protein
VFSYIKPICLAFILALAALAPVSAQEEEKKPEKAKKEEKKSSNAPVTAEQVAETAIVVYGLGGGRQTLNQIRKTTIERGRISTINAEGAAEQTNYQRWTMRADNLEKKKSASIRNCRTRNTLSFMTAKTVRHLQRFGFLAARRRR